MRAGAREWVRVRVSTRVKVSLGSGLKLGPSQSNAGLELGNRWSGVCGGHASEKTAMAIGHRLDEVTSSEQEETMSAAPDTSCGCPSDKD